MTVILSFDIFFLISINLMKTSEILLVVAVILVIAWVLRRSKGNKEAYSGYSRQECQYKCNSLQKFFDDTNCNDSNQCASEMYRIACPQFIQNGYCQNQTLTNKYPALKANCCD